MRTFEHDEDIDFFAEIMCRGAKADLDAFASHFDFRPPHEKRAEFKHSRRRAFKLLVEKFGRACMLRYPSKCIGGAKLQVDHVIPISSNELNKRLRRLKPRKGRKVKSQSFGSNHPDNLVLACPACNGHKKHRIPTAQEWQRVQTFKAVGILSPVTHSIPRRFGVPDRGHLRERRLRARMARGATKEDVMNEKIHPTAQTFQKA